ncbi:MAG: phenylalanine--tRNA ligase beta subunit-related protein, partial [Firmicutes bacterium]|nr:phenylalanine--tRNA ligase beta subunit-related protein [Bacillota bacterium]
MKVSYRWLKRHIPNLPEAATVADTLTQLGIEVVAQESWGQDYQKVELVRVTHREPHPHADHLSLVTIERGSNPSAVVITGAANGFPGEKVWYAPPGTVLPDGRVLETVMMRGIPSPGMLLSAEELGFQAATGDLWIWTEDHRIGTTFWEVIGCGDEVFDVEMTPNMAVFDQSMRGLARDLSAALQHPLTALPHDYGFGSDLLAQVEAPQRAPLYGIVEWEIHPGTVSPLWMQVLLRAIGQRPIHPAVDATNFVLWDIGQPLHAFDGDQIVLPLIVRLAREGEHLTLLDGKELSLHAEDLIIADQTGPLALAGIMGGRRAAVSEQ